MKLFLRFSFYLLGIFVFLCPVTVNGQCVNCKPGDGGFTCIPLKLGGKECFTTGNSCTVVGSCGAENEDRTGADCSLKQLNVPMVSVSDSMLRDVAQVDAALALSLLHASRLKVEFSVAKISLIDQPYTVEDLESGIERSSIAPNANSLKSTIKQRLAGRNSSTSDIATIDYNVAISENRLTIIPVGKGNSIEVFLEPAVSTTGEPTQSYRAVRFVIR